VLKLRPGVDVRQNLGVSIYLQGRGGCNLEVKPFPFHLYQDGFLIANCYLMLPKPGPPQKLFAGAVNLVLAKA
jgi:hypothetical protein